MWGNAVTYSWPPWVRFTVTSRNVRLAVVLRDSTNSHERQSIRSKTEASSPVHSFDIGPTGVQTKVLSRWESRLTDFGCVLEGQAGVQRDTE
jgi:hypothetical protein